MALKKSAERAELKTSGLAAAKKEMILQFKGMDYDTKDIMENIRVDIEENGLVDEIETMTCYIKPEDQTVYYVVNGSVNGKIPL